MTDRRAAWSRTKRNLRAMRGFLFLDYGSIRDELNSRKFQRGRAPGRGIHDCAHAWHADCWASTGPRPGGRGIRVTCGLGIDACQSLQRGRAPGGAELPYFCRASSPHSGQLQRGRAPGGAELASSALPRPALGHCFNGAAPRGARNSSWRNASREGEMRLQRGRAPGGAEFSRNESPAHIRTHCFNGAAPRGARNSAVVG